MTAVAEDLGCSWLRCVPDGAVVSRRVVREYVVAVVDGGWFSARPPGERRRRHFEALLLPVAERGQLAAGVRVWCVTERLLLPGGGVDSVVGVRVCRPRVTAEQAFRGANGGAS